MLTFQAPWSHAWRRQWRLPKDTMKLDRRSRFFIAKSLLLGPRPHRMTGKTQHLHELDIYYTVSKNGNEIRGDGLIDTNQVGLSHAHRYTNKTIYLRASPCFPSELGILEPWVAKTAKGGVQEGSTSHVGRYQKLLGYMLSRLAI